MSSTGAPGEPGRHDHVGSASRSTPAKIARALSAAAILSLIVLGIVLVRYQASRDAWRARATIDAEYDAAASDAAYASVEDAFEWARRSARGSAGLVIAAGIALGRARKRVRRIDGSRARRWAARAIDVASLGVALAVSHARTSSPAITEALAWVPPALIGGLLLGALANGATLGERALRLVAA